MNTKCKLNIVFWVCIILMLGTLYFFGDFIWNIKILIFEKGHICRNKIYSLLIILITFIVFIYGLSKRMENIFSDLMDIEDIEKIEQDIRLEKGKNYLGEEFRRELWNQINRRAEKAKIASLKSLDQRFSSLKEWLELFLKKSGL